jgi:signal transduction histidine kinase/ligand-binding sensor domain-containing protein/DNA-binding response OmpR family regulator
MIFIRFVFILQFLCVAALAQKQSLKFEHLNIEKGLSQSHATCILQDSKGFMWIGTRNGLNKYDGYKFTVYKNDIKDKNSISHSYVIDMVEDKAGNLWIATFGGGLNMFDNKREKFISYRTDKNNLSSIASDYLQGIVIDSLENIWIGNDGNGVDYFDRKKNQFIHYVNDQFNPHSLGGDNVTSIYQDSQRNLWVGLQNKGLNLFNKKDQTFTSFLPDKNSSGLFGANSVRAIFEDSKNQLWVGTVGGGLFLFDRDTKKFTQFVHDPNRNSISNNVILSLLEDNERKLWIGTENGGISILDLDNGVFHNYLQDDIDRASLSSNSIYSFCNDQKGNMWIGTYSGGINFFNRDANKFAHYRHTASLNSISHNNILSIYEDSKDNLWITTDGGGLNLMDRNKGTFTHFKSDGTKNSISGNYVLKAIEDSDGNLWIGTWGEGVTVMNRKSNTFKHYRNTPSDPHSIGSNNAWTIFKDSDNDIWIGTHPAGLELYDKKNDSFIHFKNSPTDLKSIGGNTINVITQDRKGNLWIGTNGSGLEKFDKKSKTFTHYLHDETKNSISSNIINSIFEDSEQNLWVGTAIGLNKIDFKKNQIKSYHEKDGLPAEPTFGILEDDHKNLWISTGNGITKFNIAAETFKNYGVADGLQANEFRFAHLRSRNGKMYFGGINGFNEFHPDSIHDNSYNPPLLLTNFEIFNVPIAVVKDSKGVSRSISDIQKFKLSHEQSVISFGFASLNYTTQEKKQYAYFLEGFDKDWNYVGTQHFATYTNLDPGNYTFRVKGLDNAGRWSEKTIALSIVITPPFWKTWWFRLTSLSFLVGCIVAFFKVRMHRIQKQKQSLELQVKERTEKLVILTEEERKARQEAEQANLAKSVFLATMSHEIRTPMNGVIGMASLLTETTLTTEQKEYTETIKNCGESLLGVINDILDFSKIESGKMELEKHDFDLRTCIEEVLDLFATKAAANHLDLVYEIDYNVPAQIIGDSLRLRQVIINLVSNAIKFTTKGEVFVGVHLRNRNDNKVELGFEVRDTGIGIEEDKIEKLFKAFSQVDSSTTRKYGGTGLGLVICEKLVDLMGGSIDVESKPGHGTTFSFTIQSNISHEATRTYVHHNLSDLEGKKILVVDDNATNRSILKNELNLWKLVPTLASSGDEALAILSEDCAFDLILTDMQMPHMDGMQLAHRIKMRNKNIPIILLSSIGDDKIKGQSELFSAVLTKPVRQSTLRKQILLQLKNQGKNVPEIVESKGMLSLDFAKQYPLNILIAEDNPVNYKLAERVLTKLGYRPEKAENGMLAVQAVGEKNFNVILMDVQMPIMDGMQATRKIRERKGIQPVIIAMTANAMQGDREKCIQSGMDDYISKPIKLEELIHLLEKWALIKNTSVDKNSY